MPSDPGVGRQDASRRVGDKGASHLTPEIIIETDVFSDVDDVGALALAHAYADQGRAELIAVGVNTPSRHGPRAVSIINEYFGRPVPVGACLPLDDSVATNDYARFLCTEYGDYAADTAPAAAVRVHRDALSKARDGNVTIISIGFLGNLLQLLTSGPDDLSRLSGRELIEQKVDRLVLMGGYFPTGNEFNIAEYPSISKRLIDSWPGPITFLGWEVGAGVVTGRTISLDPPHNLIGAAYCEFSGAGNGRESWDPMTVHYALGAASRFYGHSESGTVQIDPLGTTTFIRARHGLHRYVVLRARPDDIAISIDAMLESATRRAAGPSGVEAQ